MAIFDGHLLAIFISTVISYVAIGIIYRLYFSPIAHFPGRKIAAATFWYEFYWDMIKSGKYMFEIEKMHEEYGPIVRINPYELHIKDPEFYNEVYPGAASGRKVDKWSWTARVFGNETAGFATIFHDFHRMRRSAISPFFSKRAVTDFEHIIRLHVNLAVAKLGELRETKRPVNLNDLFSCLTGDIISDYTYGKAYGLLESENFSPHWHGSMMSMSKMTPAFKQFGWLFPLMTSFPDWLTLALQPGARTFILMMKDVEARITALKCGIKGEENSSEHRNIFEELVESSLPEEEKSVARLADEGRGIIGAGTVTTARILSVTIFHVLSNPDVMRRVQDELRPLFAKGKAAPTWSELEQLAFLSAVIKEGLRVAHPVVGRMARVFPEDSLKYGERIIPPRTVVSMSAYFVHGDPFIFPDPKAFKPERWLANEAAGLERYFVPFGKGTRQCVGLNLAYAELYLTLAAVFAPGQLELRLFETDYSDVEVRHDWINGAVREDSKGIRVVVE